MSRNNNNNNNGEKLNLPDHVQKTLADIGGIGYSLHANVPCSASWILTPNEIKQIITEVARSYMKDVTETTLVTDKRNGAIYGYVWLPKNSEHLNDKSLQVDNSAIKKNMVVYSSHLKEFMSTYCAQNHPQVLPSSNKKDMRCIEVSVIRFLKVEFDINGNAYAKLVGEGYKKSGRIMAEPKFLPENRDINRGRFDVLQHIKVTKTTERNFGREEPLPKKSFNAR